MWRSAKFFTTTVVIDWLFPADKNEVIVSQFQSGRDEQQWMTAHDVIVNRVNFNKVLAVQGDTAPEGAIGVHVAKPLEGDMDQLWHYHHVYVLCLYGCIHPT